MPTECSPALFKFAPLEGRRVVASFDGGAITSNAVALLLGATDRAIDLVGQFAACFRDSRMAERIEHVPAGAPGRYHRTGHDTGVIEVLFVDLFLDAHRKAPPRQIIRKRRFGALLPARGTSVLVRAEAAGFRTTLWIALATTRRAFAIGGSRF